MDGFIVKVAEIIKGYL